MNRLTFIACLAVLLFSQGCIREITLHPYELPDLVKSYIRKVECFDNENAILIASDEGVMLLYGEDQVLFDANTYDELFKLEWSVAQVLYSESTEIFWIIQDSTFIQMGKNTFDVHYDNTKFFAPTKSYFAYGLYGDGKLVRLGYWKEFWDQNSGSFYSDYYIGIYEYLGIENNTWREYQTDLRINSKFLATPNFAVDANDNIVLHTNPGFVITDYNDEETSADSISRTGQGFKFRTAFHPHLSASGNIYGMRTVPTLLSPVASMLSVGLNSKTVVEHELVTNCEIPVESQGAVKLLDWKGDVARFYIRNYTNSLTPNTEAIGYMLDYDLANDACSITTLYSNEELKWSESITDLDVLGTTVYIGTRDGLLIYDLETDEISSYLLNLLEGKIDP
ncbi:MAG: hypothetical protein RLP15_04145 [Cryomorphaceae bacterium]